MTHRLRLPDLLRLIALDAWFGSLAAISPPTRNTHPITPCVISLRNLPVR